MRSAKLSKSHNPLYKDYLNSIERCRKNFSLAILMQRVLTNVHAVFDLSLASYKRGGSLSYKLPVGLLLRNCAIDCITALYIYHLDEEKANQHLDILNHHFTKAMPEEFEVYRDKVRDIDIDDEQAQQMFTLALEDTYFEHFDFKDKDCDFNSTKHDDIYKHRKDKDIYPDYEKTTDKIKDYKDALKSDQQLGSCACSLYAYYKYFSQYEHYSENGAGDVMANFGEDNINIPMIFDHIAQAIDFVISKPCQQQSPSSDH